jgi:AraC-like DNA-binding protein
MAEAVRLLEEGELSVKEIGYQVGYQSSPSFARAFRETYGCPPMRFVEEQKEGNR